MKNTNKTLRAALACCIIAVLASCVQISGSDAESNSKAILVNLFIGNEKNDQALTKTTTPNLSIMPTTPTFSRYEWSFTNGTSTVTPEDTSDGTISVKLAAGSWTATVTAYTTWTISDVSKEYKAATGDKTFTVISGQTNSVNVVIKPLPLSDVGIPKGVFRWTLSNLSADITQATLSIGSGAPVERNLLDAASGIIELDAGAYDMFIMLSKASGASAALYEVVYIYSGLESTINVDASTTAFSAGVFIAGTATLTDMANKATRPLTVRAYADSNYDMLIENSVVEVAENGAYLLQVPASFIGHNVYLQLSPANIADGYGTTGGTAQVLALEAKGKKGVTLSLAISEAAATPTANPPGGMYNIAQNVTLNTTTESSSIYYTIDGTNPTTGSALYSGAINIPLGTTLKAIAVKGGLAQSAVMKEGYPAWTKGLYEDGNAVSLATATGSSTLTKALFWIKNNAKSNAVYTIILDADETIAPYTLNAANVHNQVNVTVRIAGKDAERTIKLSANGSLFDITGASADDKLTLILDTNITLKGRKSGVDGADNNTSLVKVNANAVLEMKGNAKITGNTASTTNSYGGGVYIGGGTLTMKDTSSISGNTSSSSSSYYGGGGGVYVSDGTFTMNDSSSVSDNTALTSSSFSYGGGVYVSDGNFTMNDASSVSDNKASASSCTYGNGVYVSHGTLTMNDSSLVSHNISSASSLGGGVYVAADAVFKMSSGTISGHVAGGFGGGVYSAGRFEMCGGVISGNTASFGGGGVYVSNIFDKTATGGVIYGENEGENSNTTNFLVGGHAVEFSSASVYYRNTTVGASDTLSTTSALPSGTGQTLNGWTKQ
ncbi:MAG: chitobiase/beta-hexosaminidase C-terminal domain-containing protein [Spirochaetaceae bacterium]|nr:chitobiase/beta-hexosaminidase C-terminal domain-containing protein [Spirochaetaceae bacterium]